MNFTKTKQTIVLIDLLIETKLELEKKQFQEDISCQKTRQYMIAQGWLKKSICGSESPETQDYFYKKAQDVLKGIR